MLRFHQKCWVILSILWILFRFFSKKTKNKISLDKAPVSAIEVFFKEGQGFDEMQKGLCHNNLIMMRPWCHPALAFHIGPHTGCHGLTLPTKGDGTSFPLSDNPTKCPLCVMLKWCRSGTIEMTKFNSLSFTCCSPV